MVERSVFGEKLQGESEVCIQCKARSKTVIELTSRGMKYEFCSFECHMRWKGIQIEDNGLERMLEERLRRGKSGDNADVGIIAQS